MFLWVFGGIEDLGLPVDLWQVDIDPDTQLQIIEEGEYRDTSILLDKLDLLYRLHWACNQLRIDNKQQNVVNFGVVYEWWYALEWLLFPNQWSNWDEVQLHP